MSPDERARVVVALDHDARQPQHAIEMGLRNLRLLVGELAEGQVASSTQVELLQRMQSELASVQAAARQIVDTQQDLVDAIRLEFDDTRPNPRTVRADDLISRAIKTNRPLAVNIELHGATSRLAFVADERWTERILNNLISNAIWHSGASHILVGARRRDGDLVLEVRDNGRGMSQDIVAQVFEPSKPPALAPVGQSAARSGLGLYNVRLFAERMGGSVECTAAPGLGTLFRVRLPGPIRAVETRSLFHRETAGQAAGPRVVAILDDDEQVLRTTERAFESQGMDVYADHDPLRWLSVVTDMKRMPDLFLVDFQLHGHDCTLQLEIVRRRWSEFKPKVVVVTAHTDDPTLLRISRDVPVLRKPLSDAKFELIVDFLSGRRDLPHAGFI